MRRLRWMGAWLIGTAFAFGATSPAPREPAAPLLALWEHAAGTSLETASPRVVIYQDGRVLAQRERGANGASGGGADFVTTQLALAQVNIWYDDIFTIAREEELKGKYVLGGRDAARAATFYFQAGAHGLLVTVEGLSQRALSPYGTLLDPSAEEVPARLLRIYQDAQRLNLQRATSWKPEWYEARFRNVSTSADATARPWPAGWPTPAAAAEGAAGIVALTAAQFESARAGWSADESTAISMNVAGTVVEVAFRPVLPGEERWRRHIAADVDAARAAHAAAARAQLGAERDQFRTALGDRVSAPSAPGGEVHPTVESAVLPAPDLDRPAPKLSPLPPAPDPPNPKSRKTR